MLQYFLFVTQILLIYVTSRFVMVSLVQLLYKVTNSTSVTFYIVSLIYLPGTVVHELSHLLTSVLLFVHPKGMTFIPEIQESDNGVRVRMGSVHHAKTDPLRSMLIGTAPLVYGLVLFYLVFELSLFPHTNIWMNILFIYVFFTVSSSMFSSKKDLQESLILIPLVLIGISVSLAFNIPVGEYLQSSRMLSIVERFNTYLLAPTIINAFLALFFRYVRR